MSPEAMTTETARTASELSTLGMSIMIVSLVGVLTLAVWCYIKVLKAPPPSSDNE